MIESLAPGLYPTRRLRQLGMGTTQLAAAVESGRLWHVIRGWYAPAGTDAQLVRAMRLGGRLGCVSALRVLGAWCPPDQGIHLAMPSSASGRRVAARSRDELSDVRIHWRLRGDTVDWADGMAPVAVALGHVVRCQPVDAAVAVLDSVIHRRIASEGMVKEIIRAAPARLRHLERLLDGRAEEGIESIARVAMLRAGIEAIPQVVIPGIGRVDLLVDGWLVIELDGRETHAQETAFTHDRRRAAALTAAGYVVIRFSYADVMYRIEDLVSAVRGTLSHRPATSRRA